uniref:type II toxin-antitoxin system HicA family toxin n=1 Tax=Massilia sp. W12 TaxID=3126507 RepID=UPI00403F70EC
MNGFYKDVIAILSANGFSFIRNGKGSHEIWGKGAIRVTVPFNCGSKFTANAIMKACKIDHKF